LVVIEQHARDLEAIRGNDELEQFAESCKTGVVPMLSAHNGNVAIAMMNAALRSIDRGGALVAVSEVMEAAKRP
jgi:hypothetical protein